MPANSLNPLRRTVQDLRATVWDCYEQHLNQLDAVSSAVRKLQGKLNQSNSKPNSPSPSKLGKRAEPITLLDLSLTEDSRLRGSASLPLQIQKYNFEQKLAAEKLQNSSRIREIQDGWKRSVERMRADLIHLREAATNQLVVQCGESRSIFGDTIWRLERAVLTQKEQCRAAVAEQFKLRQELRATQRQLQGADEELKESRESFYKLVRSRSPQVSVGAGSYISQSQSIRSPYVPPSPDVHRLVRENHELQLKNLGLSQAEVQRTMEKQNYREILLLIVRTLKGFRLNVPEQVFTRVSSIDLRIRRLEKTIPATVRKYSSVNFAVLQRLNDFSRLAKIFEPAISEGIFKLNKATQQLRRVEAKLEWFRWK